MATQNTQARLLKRPEACQRLGIGLSTYKRLVRDGALREITVGALPDSRGKRLPESEIERYIDSRLKGRGGAAA
jgi:excisionase family DNA binding protein